jgi:hypothetical protein
MEIIEAKIRKSPGSRITLCAAITANQRPEHGRNARAQSHARRQTDPQTKAPEIKESCLTLLHCRRRGDETPSKRLTSRPEFQIGLQLFEPEPFPRNLASLPRNPLSLNNQTFP